MKQFARILKLKRMAKKINHRELGLETGVHYSMIHKYENGKASPTLKSAIVLSKYLGFSLDRLDIKK